MTISEEVLRLRRKIEIMEATLVEGEEAYLIASREESDEAQQRHWLSASAGIRVARDQIKSRLQGAGL